MTATQTIRRNYEVPQAHTMRNGMALANTLFLSKTAHFTSDTVDESIPVASKAAAKRLPYLFGAVCCDSVRVHFRTHVSFVEQDKAVYARRLAPLVAAGWEVTPWENVVINGYVQGTHFQCTVRRPRTAFTQQVKASLAAMAGV